MKVDEMSKMVCDIRKNMINYIKENFNKYAIKINNDADEIFYIQNNMECINEGYTFLVDGYNEGCYETESIDYITKRRGMYFAGGCRELSELYTDELQSICLMIENLIEFDEIEQCKNAWED